MYLDSFNLKLLSTTNSTVSISTFKWNNIIQPIVNSVIKGKVNKKFAKGPVPIGDVLEKKNLTILNLSVMTTWAEYDYLFLLLHLNSEVTIKGIQHQFRKLSLHFNLRLQAFGATQRIQSERHYNLKVISNN